MLNQVRDAGSFLNIGPSENLKVTVSSRILVLTSPSVGLTDELADDAIEILNNKSLSHF